MIMMLKISNNILITSFELKPLNDLLLGHNFDNNI